MYAKISSIILMLVVTNSFCICQNTIILTHYNQFDTASHKKSFKSHTSHDNEAEQVVSILFLFYKKYISSQDVNSCVFEPSCSVYAMESIKKLGVLKGYMNSFDRLTRCHGLASEYYQVDSKNLLLYDPVF
jgi:uncharacterized protein